jgi:hypothetical protein
MGVRHQLTLSLRCLSSARVSLSTTCLGRLMSPPSGPLTDAEGGTRSRNCREGAAQQSLCCYGCQIETQCAVLLQNGPTSKAGIHGRPAVLNRLEPVSLGLCLSDTATEFCEQPPHLVDQGVDAITALFLNGAMADGDLGLGVCEDTGTKVCEIVCDPTCKIQPKGTGTQRRRLRCTLQPNLPLLFCCECVAVSEGNAGCHVAEATDCQYCCCGCCI